MSVWGQLHSNCHPVPPETASSCLDGNFANSQRDVMYCCSSHLWYHFSNTLMRWWQTLQGCSFSSSQSSIRCDTHGDTNVPPAIHRHIPAWIPSSKSLPEAEMQVCRLFGMEYVFQNLLISSPTSCDECQLIIQKQSYWFSDKRTGFWGHFSSGSATP